MLDKNIEEIVSNFLLKEAEKSYSRRRLGNIFRLFYDGIWIIDNKRKVKYANIKIIKKLKCHSQDIIDKDFRDFIFKEDRRSAVDIMQKPISGKSLHKFRLRCFDGEEIFIKCYIKAFYNNKDYAGSIIVFRDDLEK